MKTTYVRWFLLAVLLTPQLGWADKAPPPRPQAHDGHHDGHHGGHESGGDKPMVHRFEDPAKWSAIFDGPERDAWQKPKEIVKRLQIAPGMTVADIGAGTGYLMPHLAQATGDKGKVLAIDIEPKMVLHLTDRAKKAKLGQVSAQLGEPSDPKLTASSPSKAAKPPETVAMATNTCIRIDSPCRTDRHSRHSMNAANRLSSSDAKSGR